MTDFLHATAAAAREKHPEIEYHITGELVLNRAMRDAIDGEMAVLGPVMLGTMLLPRVHPVGVGGRRCARLTRLPVPCLN